MPHQCTSCARQFADGSKEMLSGCPDCSGTKFQFMPSGGAPAGEEPPSRPDRGTGTMTETVGHVATKLRDFVGDDPSPPRGRTAEPGGERTATSASTQVSSETSSSIDGSDDTPSIDPDTDSSGRNNSGRNSSETASSGTNSSGPDNPTVDGPPADNSLERSSSPEDGAQSTARSQMVSPDELPDGPAYVGTSDDGNPEPTPESDAESQEQTEDSTTDESPDLSQLREELNDQFEGIRITNPGQYELNLMELYEREETIIALQENGRYVIEPPETWRGDEQE